jgi:hypothetical protein
MNYKKSIFNVDPRNLHNGSLYRETDYAIEKGDYIKLDNITLTFAIPQKNRILAGAEIFVSCNNIATFTKFTGGDPETAGITGAEPGYYFYEKYPNTRLYVLGFRVEI